MAPFSVRAALDQYVERNQSIREPDGKWHPSGMFACLRKAVYEVRGVERSDPRDERSQRVLYVGSRWHEIVQQAVAESGMVDEVRTEVPIDLPDLNIVGSADQLVRKGKKWTLLEYKSINSRGFGFLKGKPKPEHIDQAKVYAFALRASGIPVSEIGFVYISKDDLRVEEFTVKWNPKWEDEIRERVAELDGYRLDGGLPPRQEKKNAFPCSWGKGETAGRCEFFTRCWEQDPDEEQVDF